MQKKPFISNKQSLNMPNKLSIVVPAYEEAKNIRPLTERLFENAEKKGIDLDLLIMDDESSKPVHGSEASRKVVSALQKEGYGVRIHCRKKSEGKGLSSAVVLGMKMAKHPVMLCMDADLQHRPQDAPRVAEPVLTGKCEFTVGSRNVEGGKVAEWACHRKLISFVATLLAWPVTSCRDPMSGFFCINRETFERGVDSLNVKGFKIGLELMVRCRPNRVVEVPITFMDREEGESKLTMTQNIYYIQQLLSLYLAKYGAGFLLVFLAILAGLAYTFATYVGLPVVAKFNSLN